MAYHGPAYGLSRECQMKSQAKFDLNRAREGCDWVESVTKITLDFPSDEGLIDQLAFGHALKDGIALCTLLNQLQPGLVKRINTMKAPFKQRENVEMFLKGCETYGLKSQDLFQVNDLYENKNLYMIVDCLQALGGLAQKRSFDGPTIGVKVAKENKRNFTMEKLRESQNIIGLQYGSNKGSSQAGMTAYGTGRQIIPGEAQKIVTTESHKIIGLQSGSNKGASQAGMTPYGAARQIIPDGLKKQPSRHSLSSEVSVDESSLDQPSRRSLSREVSVDDEPSRPSLSNDASIDEPSRPPLSSEDFIDEPSRPPLSSEDFIDEPERPSLSSEASTDE